ncbi:SMR domain-containing protein [Zea mays]|uniref:SMR domain-containing protein n=1 Tax=Zea mays TaxID=4577 RepID=A0A1D6MFB3_MAIZE|nr:SMR domain-containing protein [Zea mays]ONM28316.1 SMR domain-containing protein [Zea mays]
MKPSLSKKKGKKKKKSSLPAAAPAPPPAEGAADTEACPPLPGTITLTAATAAAAVVSETESSSSGEASTCPSACFTASSSGTASSHSFSALSSSASTASSSAAGEERRDLTWLLDAFASATFDQIDSAYREAGGDPFVAAGILSSTQDTHPPQPPQPAPQPPPPPDLSPRSGSGGRKAGRRPKRVAVAATGMVADVIGKEYTRPAANSVVSMPNAWKGRDGESDGSGSGGRKDSVEEAEQFLCSMLGDNSELGMGVVRDVLGQYGYDVEKALDALLDISGVSSVENMETNHQSARRNDTCHLDMFSGNGLSVENLTAGNRRSLRQLTDEISNTGLQSELGHEFLWGEPQIR